MVGLADLSAHTVLEAFEQRGWGDGLPLVPPTEDLVDAMLAGDGGDPEEVLAVLPPRRGLATRRIAAVNAVLAGCPPRVFPVLVTALRALGDERLNAKGFQATTGPSAPLVIVHGRAVDDLGFNSGHGLFGPGNRANATVGRAVRLLLMHVGGARAGSASMCTQGQPAQYTFCIGENEVQSPWPAYHRSRRVDAPSAVTVACLQGPVQAQDHISENATGILDSIASVVATIGWNHTYAGDSELFVVFGPEHAAQVAAEGWAREDVQMYLYERARLPLRTLLGGGCGNMNSWPTWMRSIEDPDRLLPVTQHPDLYRVLVGGGVGKHSSVLPSWGLTTSVTLPLEVPPAALARA